MYFIYFAMLLEVMLTLISERVRLDAKFMDLTCALAAKSVVVVEMVVIPGCNHFRNHFAHNLLCDRLFIRESLTADELKCYHCFVASAETDAFEASSSIWYGTCEGCAWEIVRGRAMDVNASMDSCFVNVWSGSART